MTLKISVALAAYKGEKYICEQISSILPQLGENDEIVVSDDYPAGETKSSVLSLKDPRIIYVTGPSKGVTANFENAVKHCSGDIIFLCDQDDVWLPGKVEKIVSEINNGSDLVLHDSKVADADLTVISDSYFSIHGTSTSLIGTLLRNTYVGCCMAFTEEVAKMSLPFPTDIPMHDWWIALVAMKKKMKISIVKEPLIMWRRHGDNVTGGKTSLALKLKWRLTMLRYLISVH